MNTQFQQGYDDRTMDLGEVFTRLWARRLWLLASVIVFTAAFGISAFLMTPQYRVTAVLAASNAEREGMGAGLGAALGQLGGLAALAGLGLGGNAGDTEEAIAVMQSREFTEAFIRDHNLLPELFAEKWDAAAKRWKVPADEQPTMAKGYKRFDKSIRSVVRDKKTGLVMVQIDWKDRREAADWANDLVTRLNAEMRGRAIRKADAYVTYLEKELTTTYVVATREAINRLIEAQTKQRMFANVNQDYAFRVVDSALPPDADDPIRPRRVLMMAGGFALGLVFGVAAALFFSRPRSAAHVGRGHRSPSSLATTGE